MPDKPLSQRRLLQSTQCLLLLCSPAGAAPDCDAEDIGFDVFLRRFKTNQVFRENRLQLPLHISVRGPDDTRTERLTLQQIRERRMQIIVDEKVAAELHNTEGRLCESKAVVRHNRATFTQYSCETDVYGNRFHFVFLRGCWWLQRVDYSGG
ncbi:MAG: hypothetical protein RL210_858 [Pseudomonadota bacterium]|jgi:hypothetical protein